MTGADEQANDRPERVGPVDEQSEDTGPRPAGRATDGGGPDRDRDGDPNPDIDDVLDDLEELEELVDSPEEREQVREAIRTARRADRSGLLRVREAFDLRDVGEALVGSFVFGIPMVVEGGTLEIGEAIADSPLVVGATAGFGLAVTLGILHAAGFEDVEADLWFGVLPGRLVGILAIAGGMSVGLMTLWGRVDWSQPSVAVAQCLVTGVVMAVGASVGDVLPE